MLLIFHQRFILAFLTLFILLPQTPKENSLLAEFYESGLFSNYLEASTILKIVTFSTIFLFFLIVIL
uniref:Uncharacterized protein n=1 Tax=Derbesia sp. WEST4838 TaxID=1847751 RepID=A0A1C9JBD1_9CHLO|nr:hypothetical protein [Derbesia sp. WEST4838]AOP19148.1 hypothetical protein [Derbesia sp. WEST4838]